MIIAPVIFCTVVTGIAGMTSLEEVGRVGVKALVYFLAVSTLVLIVGLVVANVIQPGYGLHINPASLDQSAGAAYQAKAAEQGVGDFLLHVILDTAIGAFASGEILQVLLFSVLFGFGLALMGERGRALYELIRQIYGVIFSVMNIIVKVAPLGALGAMAFTIGKYGIGSLSHLAALVGSFYLTSLIFVLGVLGLIARAAGFRS